jgi:pilus assembly protein Flp/PilA
MRRIGNRRGQGMTEYIIIVAIIAIAAIAAFKIFGGKLKGSIEKTGTALEQEVGKGVDEGKKEVTTP